MSGKENNFNPFNTLYRRRKDYLIYLVLRDAVRFSSVGVSPRTNLIWWRILPSLYFVRWLQFSCRCRNWVSFGAWSYYWIHWSKNSPSCPNSSSSPYWKSQESNRLADYLPIGFRQCPTIARTFPGSAFKVVYNIPNHSRKKLLSVNSYWDPVTAAGI